MKYLKLTLLLIFCTSSFAHAQCAKIDSLFRILSVIKTPIDSINTLNALAEAYIHVGREGQASIVVSKSLQMAEKNRYEKGIADALSHVAIMDYKDLKESSPSIQRYQKALKIYQKLGDKQKTVQMLETLGAYYTKFPNRANHLKALEHYEQALSIRQKLPSQAATVQLYENIGWVYCQLEKDKEAIQAFRDAEELRQKLGMDNKANTRILAKYERINVIENRIQNSDTFMLITVFGIIIAILAVVTSVSWMRQNRARRLLKVLQEKRGQVEV